MSAQMFPAISEQAANYAAMTAEVERRRKAKPLDVQTPNEGVTQLVAWPYWAAPNRMVLAIAPLASVPELKDRLTKDEAFRVDGQPYVVLGEMTVISTEGKSAGTGQPVLVDGYIPAKAYNSDEALRLTTCLRDRQLEEQLTRAGPGKEFARLERALELLKGRGK